ncbi:hypothetical protein BH10PLA2_BH10PLA2_37080 [soil metagenome]
MKLLTACLLAGSFFLIADDSDLTKKDLQKMQGEWAAVEVVREGNPLERDAAQAYFRTVKDETYIMARFRKVVGKGTFNIDATKSPRHIDATPAPPNTKTLKGIYEWDGDKLKIIFGPPDGERPTDFKTEPGSPNSYTLWERESR